MSSFYYISNVESQFKLLDHVLKNLSEMDSSIDFLLLSNLINPVFSSDETAMFRHAMLFLQKAFEEQEDFSDFNLYVKSFRHDKSAHILVKSAKTVLDLIDLGKKQYETLVPIVKEMFAAFDFPIRVIPGQNENMDLIFALEPSLKTNYLNVRYERLGGVGLLGIGGTQKENEDMPEALQDHEYYEGGLDAKESLREMFEQDIDVFVSYAPLMGKCHVSEEQNIRPFVNQYLPGKLILTGQEIGPNGTTLEKIATGASLLRGGYFSLSTGPYQHLFWKISMGENIEIMPLQWRDDDIQKIEMEKG